MKAPKYQRNWPSLSEPAIRHLQRTRLRDYLKRVVLPFSAHYREIFQQQHLSIEDLRSWDAWEQVPFTSKDDLVNTPCRPQKIRDFLLLPDERLLCRRASTIWRAVRHGRQAVKEQFEAEFRPVFMTSTTGRSAEPIPFLFTQYDLARLQETGRRVFEVCGATRELRLFSLFPYAPHLAFWQVHYGATALGVFMISTGGGKVMGTDGNLRLMQKVEPDVLIGMPTYLYHLLQQAAEEGRRFPKLRRLVLGGEKVPAGIRHKLDALSRKLGSPGIEVVATYGFTEARMAWGECPFPIDQEPSGYHLYPDLGLIEIIDPGTGRVVPPGHPGEIVFTPLDGRGTVVLRYRTGDMIDGGLIHEPCRYCGRTVPRLVGNISRRSEIRSVRLEKLKGTLVDFNALERVLDDAADIGSWQLEIRKRNDDPLDLDELILHVQTVNGRPPAQIARDLKTRFLAATETRPNRIVFHDAEGIRQLQGVDVELKERKIVDHRPRQGDAETQFVNQQSGAPARREPMRGQQAHSADSPPLAPILSSDAGEGDGAQNRDRPWGRKKGRNARQTKTTVSTA